MKKKYIYAGSVAAILLASHIGLYQLGKHQVTTATKDNKIAYVNDIKKSRQASKKDKTMDQVSAEEGITAEQIVVKITDQGYVTSHGDHFHFYNGKVPYDAILSEELIMTDPNYQFKQSDVVNEVLDGYIIKVDGKYYVYLKPGSQRKNIRSKQEIAEQAAKGSREAKEKGLAKVSHLSKAEVVAVNQARSQGRYTTDDGYIFSPTDVIDDFGDAYLVPHGNHFHYIPKKDLSPSELAAAQAYWSQKNGGGSGSSHHTGYHPFPNSSSHRETGGHWTPGHGWHNGNQGSSSHRPSGSSSSDKQNNSGYEGKSFKELLDLLHRMDLKDRHVESDGLIFEPTQVVRANDFGYVVPHGDHYHIIPRNQLSALEILLADRYLAGQTHDTPKPHQPDKDKTKKVIHTFLGHSIRAYGKGLDGKPYDTSDNYVFSKESIYSVDKSGVTARHGSHFHYVGLGELEQNELDQVAEWLKAKGQDKELAKSLEGTEKEKFPFDAKNVSRKVVNEGKVGYMMTKDGKDYFYDRDHLDLTQIAFAEQELMLKDKNHYKYDIKDDGIKPALLVNLDSLPMHVGNASYDTGVEFIIPHIDHIHVVRYDNLKKEQIATIKYLMSHPEVRPEPWTQPHGKGEKKTHTEQPKYIVNVTPVEKRHGLPNWMIIHSVQEVQQAIKEGRYASTDGYIFDPQDILDARTFVWRDGSFTIPRAEGGSLRAIRKNDLSDSEWQKAQEFVAKRRASDAAREKKADKKLPSEKPSEKPSERSSEKPSIPSENSAANETKATEEKPHVPLPKEKEVTLPEADKPAAAQPSESNSLPTSGRDRATLEAPVNQLAPKEGVDPK
ncbi:histidine triad protein [Streptococcus pseudoporcinus]|uniref:Histidine triad protein n=1 Tax=Streptococcus pseudoporcinus TaxID=361101 RepID=A0A4U9ZM15_9STRE|nr:pneumococcal-type histidine triad protein [Streptococcus pseudoporcinus]VTS40624.1 histidine triad protein [Streptococcus pseudoporcinus]